MSDIQMRNLLVFDDFLIELGGIRAYMERINPGCTPTEIAAITAQFLEEVPPSIGSEVDFDEQVVNYVAKLKAEAGADYPYFVRCEHCGSRTKAGPKRIASPTH